MYFFLHAHRGCSQPRRSKGNSRSTGVQLGVCDQVPGAQNRKWSDAHKSQICIYIYTLYMYTHMYNVYMYIWVSWMILDGSLTFTLRCSGRAPWIRQTSRETRRIPMDRCGKGFDDWFNVYLRFILKVYDLEISHRQRSWLRFTHSSIC